MLTVLDGRSVPSEQVFASDRTFQVWRYIVSHKQLLLRSAKSETATTRIDVLFKGVEAIELPTSLDGLRIAVGNSGADVLRQYQVEDRSRVGNVEALTCQVSEDAGEYFEPSSLLADTDF